MQQRGYTARYVICLFRIQGAVWRSTTGGMKTILRLGKVLEPCVFLKPIPSIDESEYAIQSDRIRSFWWAPYLENVKLQLGLISKLELSIIAETPLRCQPFVEVKA